jgi:GntR family carbon starvation induced transcriptional regulator
MYRYQCLRALVAEPNCLENRVFLANVTMPAQLLLDSTGRMRPVKKGPVGLEHWRAWQNEHRHMALDRCGQRLASFRSYFRNLFVVSTVKMENLSKVHDYPADLLALVLVISKLLWKLTLSDHPGFHMSFTDDKTLTDSAYRRLRSDIVTGRLLAGSKLKLEGLISEYRVGMSPLREALSRLIGDLLVVSEGQRGFWVASLSLEELDDVTHVRALIEAEALRLSIERGDAGWERGVTAAFDDLAKIERDLPHTADLLDPAVLDEWESRNRDFHSALASASGSPILIKLRDLLYRQSERYRRVSVNTSRGWRNVHDEHVAIYEAALARNALRACRMTELHLAKTAKEVRRAIVALSGDHA